VVIVANPAEGIWSSAETWTLEEELRIGTLEGDPEYQFGQVGWLAVNSEGAIYVIDAQAQHIQAYSPDGEYLQTIGQRGAGPGELQQAGFIFVGPGDTLIVPDIANQRVNRYAPDGSSTGSFRVELEKGIPLLYKATSTGVIAEQVRPFSLPGQPAIEDPQDAIVLRQPDGTVIDTVRTFPSGETFSFAGGAPEFNLYSPEPVWEITDDLRLAFGVNDSYRFGLYATDGTLERMVTMPYEQQPVTDADKDAVSGWLERQWADAGVPPQALATLRNAVHFKDFFPAFNFINSGPSGTLWVQHVQKPSDLTEEQLESYNLIEDSGASDWDVFDSEGRFLGVVSMPERFAPRVFVGDKIYGVWRDELDVQYVVRLRIVGDLNLST
jgi:sugar lactone lactonase YvrE